mmetsp:Transcript_33213/g.45145  ORF Transcript_33213/g.45145 Transcript_33213/m.45145 type:complete len:83 (+) Transcript_33213:49-297(+)
MRIDLFLACLPSGKPCDWVTVSSMTPLSHMAGSGLSGIEAILYIRRDELPPTLSTFWFQRVLDMKSLNASPMHRPQGKDVRV